MYSGHSFDIYTFIQHTFCLYLEALNRPDGRHAKVIIGADIIHSQQTLWVKELKQGREVEAESYLVTTQI